MLNVFYCFSTVWSMILILYSIGLSELCVPLDPKLLLFLLFIIIITFILGKKFDKYFKFIKLEENPHKTSWVTVFLAIYFILEMLYAHQIPLLNVLRGQSFLGYTGIPILNVLFSAFSIFYSIYLSYLYACFKRRKELIEFLVILLYFLLLVQRQNIFICIMFFINNLFAERRSNENNLSAKKKILAVLIGVLILSIGLYIFGIMGNMRYGTWEWNDSSMITTLGKMSDSYPNWLPKEYFWSYLYLVSPLVNLNANVMLPLRVNLFNYLMEFIPELIRNNLFVSFHKISIYLPVTSLNASTAYSRSYIFEGFFGMLLMYGVQITLCIIVLLTTYNRNRRYFIVSCNVVLYFLVFSFFDNTIVYSTSALMLIFSLFSSVNFVIKRKNNNFYRNYNKNINKGDIDFEK